MKPYYNHPKGCPNFGKKQGCPPTAPLYEQIYNLAQPVYAIINEFDMTSHVEQLNEKLKAKGKEWSEHQLRCVLYWQPKARKQLEQHITGFLRDHPGYSVERCPEAMGVDITETLAHVEINLEWPPLTVAYQVALAGIRKVELFGR
ncbi:MAG TPA: hypothetical protein VN426_06285 [Syntrophomonadaceae bacterium]|nr:hypothetical protein [Syntrophomonadaceae bacterium]